MNARALSVGLVSIALLAGCSSAHDAGGSSDDSLSSVVAGIDETALDRSTDPCTDFYQFACGGFLASLPPTTTSWTRYGELRKAQDALFSQVFAEIRRAPASDADKKATYLFDSCVATSNHAGSTPYVHRLLDEVAGVSTREELAALVGSLQRRGVPVFFNAYATTDTIFVGRQSSISFYPTFLSRGIDLNDPAGRAAYVGTSAKAFRSFDADLTENAATEAATTAATVEAALAKLQPATSSTHPLGREGLALAAPTFPWDAYFTALGAGANVDLGNFNVPALGYFAGLADVVASTDLAALRAYVSSAIVARFNAVVDVDADKQRAKCESGVLARMPDVFEARFLAAAGVDAAARARATAMFTSITDAFSADLDAATFLDLDTRVEAKAKLRHLRSTMGASATYDDYADLDIDSTVLFAVNAERIAIRNMNATLAGIGKPVPLDHVGWTVSTVNASYSPWTNMVDVPGGILGGYYFSPSGEEVANYAVIGSVLGHELTHGFDTLGRQYDGNGVRRDWWSPSVAAAYNQSAQCLIDQYSAFVVDGVTDPTTGAPAHIDGQRSIGENIADNGGVKLAYHAANVEGHDGPLVAGFTPAQQYFVGYAQAYCEKMDAPTQLKMLKDTHSPGKARVNLPLANFDGFASAFQCAPGAPMAPANRCTVW